MSMYLTDEMLAQAAKNVGETMLASLPDPEEYYHEFLPDFEQRMERLIRRTEKKRHSSVPAESCRSSPCIGGWAERLDGG